MFAVGESYRFSWYNGEGESYEYAMVLGQQGTVVQVQYDDGREAVINTGTSTFIRADPWPIPAPN